MQEIIVRTEVQVMSYAMGEVQRKEQLLVGIPMAANKTAFVPCLNIKVYVFGKGGNGIHNYESSFCISRIMGV